MKKKILILSGVHGNEQSAIQVGLRLMNHYKDDTYITVVPFVNKQGMIDNTRETDSYNTNDINRMFKKDYSFNKKELEDLIEENDIVIDIHNSPRCANFFLIDNNCSKQNIIIELCRRSGVMYASRHTKGGTIKDYVNSLRNKIGFTYEFAGMITNNLYERVSAFEDICSLINTINNLDWSNFLIENRRNKSLPKHELKEMYSPITGFIDFHFDAPTDFERGTHILSIHDLDDPKKNPLKIFTDDDIEIIDMAHTTIMRGDILLQYIEKE